MSEQVDQVNLSISGSRGLNIPRKSAIRRRYVLVSNDRCTWPNKPRESSTIHALFTDFIEERGPVERLGQEGTAQIYAFGLDSPKHTAAPYAQWAHHTAPIATPREKVIKVTESSTGKESTYVDAIASIKGIYERGFSVLLSSGKLLYRSSSHRKKGKGLVEYEPLAGIKFRKISLGYDHGLFLAEDGRVFSISFPGTKNHGQLGNGTDRLNFFPVEVKNLSGIVKVRAGRRGSYFVDSRGDLFACGWTSFSPLKKKLYVPEKLMSDVSRVFVGPHSFTVFVQKTDRRIYATGFNIHGQCGVGFLENCDTWEEVLFEDRKTAELLEREEIVKISSTRDASFILLSSGTVLSTGEKFENGFSVLTDRFRVLPSFSKGDGRVIDFFCGENGSVFLTDTGTLCFIGAAIESMPHSKDFVHYVRWKSVDLKNSFRDEVRAGTKFKVSGWARDTSFVGFIIRKAARFRPESALVGTRPPILALDADRVMPSRKSVPPERESSQIKALNKKISDLKDSLRQQKEEVRRLKSESELIIMLGMIYSSLRHIRNEEDIENLLDRIGASKIRENFVEMLASQVGIRSAEEVVSVSVHETAKAPKVRDEGPISVRRTPKAPTVSKGGVKEETAVSVHETAKAPKVGDEGPISVRETAKAPKVGDEGPISVHETAKAPKVGDEGPISVHETAKAPKVSKGDVKEETTVSVRETAKAPKVSKGDVKEETTISVRGTAKAPKVSKGDVKEETTISVRGTAKAPEAGGGTVSGSSEDESTEVEEGATDGTSEFSDPGSPGEGGKGSTVESTGTKIKQNSAPTAKAKEVPAKPRRVSTNSDKVVSSLSTKEVKNVFRIYRKLYETSGRKKALSIPKDSHIPLPLWNVDKVSKDFVKFLGLCLRPDGVDTDSREFAKAPAIVYRTFAYFGIFTFKFGDLLDRVRLAKKEADRAFSERLSGMSETEKEEWEYKGEDPFSAIDESLDPFRQYIRSFVPSDLFFEKLYLVVMKLIGLYFESLAAHLEDERNMRYLENSLSMLSDFNYARLEKVVEEAKAALFAEGVQGVPDERWKQLERLYKEAVSIKSMDTTRFSRRKMMLYQMKVYDANTKFLGDISTLLAPRISPKRLDRGTLGRELLTVFKKLNALNRDKGIGELEEMLSSEFNTNIDAILENVKNTQMEGNRTAGNAVTVIGYRNSTMDRDEFFYDALGGLKEGYPVVPDIEGDCGQPLDLLVRVAVEYPVSAPDVRIKAVHLATGREFEMDSAKSKGRYSISVTRTKSLDVFRVSFEGLDYCGEFAVIIGTGGKGDGVRWRSVRRRIFIKRMQE